MDLEQVFSFLQPMLESLSGKYGPLLQGLTIMASLRLVFKPLMSALDGLVEIIPGDGDNKLLDKIKCSKYYKGVVFMVDYFASIKLPKKKQ